MTKEEVNELIDEYAERIAGSYYTLAYPEATVKSLLRELIEHLTKGGE